jgi:AraC-like DNA-binding protein
MLEQALRPPAACRSSVILSRYERRPAPPRPKGMDSRAADRPHLNTGERRLERSAAPLPNRIRFNSEALPERDRFPMFCEERRLEKTAELLRHPQKCNRKIADIAAEAGFHDLSYFNRAFRRHYGATPSDIRASVTREIGMRSR